MRARRIIGWILVSLVAAALVLAGAGKLLGFTPDIVEGLREAGLGEEVVLIGAGAIVTGVALVVPITSSAGVLLASSYWGGAICSHMVRDESYLLPAVLLVLTWLGASLRDPDVLHSFRPLWGGK